MNDRKSTGRLPAFLSKSERTDTRLPFVHTTHAYSFSEIIGGDTLDPTWCQFFKGHYLYFFLGRPAYRHRDNVNSYLEFNWPVVFVLDQSCIEGLVRMHPFDTGAFSKEIYRDFFSDRQELKDFELKPTQELAAKIIETFYGSDEAYFFGRSTKNVEISPMDFEAQGIDQLSKLPSYPSPSGIRRDDRSAAIEFQADHPVNLREALRGIVIPQPYLKIEEVTAAIGRWGVDRAHVRFYDVYHNQSTDTWIGLIYSEVVKLYRDLGILPS